MSSRSDAATARCFWSYVACSRLRTCRVWSHPPTPHGTPERRASWCAPASPKRWPHDLGGHDLVIAVNVIEHSPDPARFLAALAAMTKPGGRIVVVCPDGSEPSTELLFFDHLSSIDPLRLLPTSPRALGSPSSARAERPRPLGPFRLYVLSRGRRSLPHRPPGPSRSARGVPTGLEEPGRSAPGTDRRQERHHRLRCWRSGTSPSGLRPRGVEPRPSGHGGHSDRGFLLWPPGRGPWRARGGAG